MTRVAFLGLGAIGRPMARHLAPPRSTLTVWNRTAARAAAFATETGATAATTPRDAAANADIVITCLPSSREVEEIVGGRDGLLAGMRKGCILVDCTSGDPGTSRRIAQRLESAGIEFLDAPVSGGVSGAERAALTVMVGGESAVLERVREVLSAFGSNIV